MTFTSVTGPSIEAIVIYADTGTESTSPLIAYIDTATGLESVSLYQAIDSIRLAA